MGFKISPMIETSAAVGANLSIFILLFLKKLIVLYDFIILLYYNMVLSKIYY